MPGLNLTREEAQQRSTNLKVHGYDVVLDLTGDADTFRSQTEINFAANPGTETFVDLVSDNIRRIVLNGQELSPGVHQDHRIQLSGLQEENTLFVDADCNYMHTGEGLHTFVDPADGLRYCYSQFEVPDARRVFATFEQPDLKSIFTFSVITPAGWTVFSNSVTPEPTKTAQGLRFDFPPTQVISTYITAIVAGPYVGETSSLVSSDGREIPLGVYCRQSLLPYLDADTIFAVTKKGFKFFEEAYGIPYPFTKYDQIFVPEYNAGAMENAGCVTFRDQYIFRSKPTAWELENRSNTILHELAHMWFGDLVTMEWWNDLWLNESFAEFMSHLALAEGTEWKDAWIGFLSRKEWGLNQDQLPSTHPIKAEIRDLQDVEVNFDGITYAKGAAVLRQLVSYVGRENFFAGLHEYLTKHSYANATLDDLLGELEATSGRDLRAWSKVWLEEAGVTTLRPKFSLDDDGNFTELSITQEATTPGASLRPHRLIIAGYDQGDDGKVHQTFSWEVDIDGHSTPLAIANGVRKPQLLLVNDQDLAYAKVRLDAESLAFAVDQIDKITDPLTRRILIAAAWDMTRDAEMSATDFIALALRDAAIEDNIATLTSLLQRIEAAIVRYTAPANRVARSIYAADRLGLLAKAAAADTDQQQLLVRAAARTATTAEQYSLVEKLYTGEATLLGLDVDIDLQWLLLLALIRGGRAGETQIAAQLEKDPTLTGQQRAAQARAALNSDTTRNHTWDEVLHNTELSNDTLRAMMAGFWANVTTEPVVYTEFVEKFFDEVVRTWKAHTFHVGASIIEGMFPSALAGYLPQVDVVGRAQKWLDNHTDQSDQLRRLIIEGQADSVRMLAAQQRDAEGTAF